ncbi:MAG: hypothetical protein HQ534_12835 [Armatimonadetes bacterium]|nr:hypothetical protein [Armatimonadota bacterium]
MNQHILLEEEQKQLLELLVEASRNVKREKRRKFVFFGMQSSAIIDHPGLLNGGVEAYMGDIETLAREGLIALSDGKDSVHSFYVTSEGFKYYEGMKLSQSQPVQRVENAVKHFISTDRFRHKYSDAYIKWAEAEILLWSSDSQRQLTMIGHLCREALQDFATVLVDQHRPSNVDADKAHTVARIRSVLELRRNQIGSTESKFLKALLTYWKRVNNLIQRQEHGGQKEGEPLIWEDGRRVVFQTAILIMEIDSALSKVT